jgi:hypothetical protein
MDILEKDAMLLKYWDTLPVSLSGYATSVHNTVLSDRMKTTSLSRFNSAWIRRRIDW